MKLSGNSGVALIELIVAMVVMAIVLAMAVPTYLELVRSTRLTTGINEFVAALNYARSEAVKQSANVTIARAGDEWENGWRIFTDDNGNGKVDGTDHILRVHEGMPTGFTLRNNNNFKRLTFRPDGQSGQMASFALCEDGNHANQPRAGTSRLISISLLGRVSLATDDDHDGIPENNDGQNLASCFQ